MKSCALMSLFLFCAFLALVGLAVVTHEQSPVTQAQRQQELLYRQQRDAQDLAEREAAAAWWTQFRQDMTPVLWLVVIAVGVALAAGAAVGMGILLADLIFAIRRRAALVYPDARGLLPADYQRLRRGDYDGHSLTALAGYHAAQLEAARQPRLPDELRTYAPRYIEGKAAPRVIGGPEPRPALDAPASPGSPLAIPTFADLLRLGQVGAGRALVLGYTLDGTPVKGDMDSLFSFAVAGLQGAGKTTTERFLLGQVALQGGRFALIDPHRDVPGGQSLAGTLAPLSAMFLLPPAADDAEIYQVIELVNAEIDRRERGEQGPVIVLAVDEWTDLSRRRCAPDLQALARRVSTVGRKLGVYAALSGQGWTKESAGEVRDYLTAAYVHKLRPQVARLLAPGVGNEVWTLEPGQAILDRTNGPRLVVTVPNTTGQDLAAVAGLLPAPAVVSEPTPLRVRPFTDFGKTRRAEVDEVDEAAPKWPEVARSGNVIAFPGPRTEAREVGEVGEVARSGEVDERDLRALELMRGGNGIPPVSMTSAIQTVYGIKGGEAFQRHAARLRALMLSKMDNEAAEGD